MTQKSINKKRSKAGVAGRGVNAFVPRKAKKVDALQKRIDMVVAAAKAREAAGIEQHDGSDVMRNKLPLFRGSRVRGSRL